MIEALYSASDSRSQSRHVELQSQLGATSTYLRVAQEYEVEFGRESLDGLIRSNVPDLEFEPGEAHRLLLSLPWADVLTTNWDTLLERAAARIDGRVYQVVRSVEDIPAARSPRIVKLHGSLPANRPFVFTEEDFRTYEDRFAPLTNLARQVSMENVLVLVGFSGDDPNFLYWSGWVRDRLRDHAPSIYLVGPLALSQSQRKALNRRRVQPIDLADLPAYSSWPEDSRAEHAARWFLEELRSAEPYRKRRWPRPKPEPHPALVFATPKSRADSPVPEPSADRREGEDAVAFVRRVVAAWRINRELYPGWVVAPRAVQQLVWFRTERLLRPILDAVSKVPLLDALDALFELNWRYELALVPLAFDLAEPVRDVLAALEPEIAAANRGVRGQFWQLAIALVRHAREENDVELFDKWVAALQPLAAADGDVASRLEMERLLLLRARLDFAALETRVTAWEPQGDAMWLVRKASVLADLGRDRGADTASEAALGQIRERTAKDKEDVFAWSRESYALVLREAFTLGWRDAPSDIVVRPVREQLRERQEELASRTCDALAELEWFRSELDRAPIGLADGDMSTHAGFDLGTINRTFHLGAPHPLVVRLRAFQAIRFTEESGLPARAGYTTISQGLLRRAAVWLQGLSPRGIRAFVPACDDPSDKHLAPMFSRAGVASLDDAQTAELSDRLLNVLRQLAPAASAIQDRRDPRLARIGIALELLSRLVVRNQSPAEELLALALSVHRDLSARLLGPNEAIGHAVRRSLEVLPRARRVELLPSVYLARLPDRNASQVSEDDPIAQTSMPSLVDWTPASWRPATNYLLSAIRADGTRAAAAQRLTSLCLAGVLTADERATFGAALWDPTHVSNGLPLGTGLSPWVFAELPHPQEATPGDTLKGRVLALTTDPVEWASLGLRGAPGLAHREQPFSLTQPECVNLLARLMAPQPAATEAHRVALLFGGPGEDERNEARAEILAGVVSLLRHSAKAAAILEPIIASTDPAVACELTMPALARGGFVGSDVATSRLREALHLRRLRVEDSPAARSRNGQ